MQALTLGLARGIVAMRPFCGVTIGLRQMFKYIVPWKMFWQLNGLVDPTEVPSQLAGPGCQNLKLTFIFRKAPLLVYIYNAKAF